MFPLSGSLDQSFSFYVLTFFLIKKFGDNKIYPTEKKKFGDKRSGEGEEDWKFRKSLSSASMVIEQKNR